jgi:hypothetical protein
MPSARFEPAIPAGDRPQTLALDRSATGIGKSKNYTRKYGEDWEIYIWKQNLHIFLFYKNVFTK